MPLREPRQRAPVVQPQHAQLHERLRERVGDLDVVEHALCRRELPQLVEVHLVHDLLLEREGGAPLVRQRRVGDRPTVVQRADELVVGHEHLVEEHLVELGVAGDLHQRPHLDARRAACRRRGTRSPCASGRRGRCGRGRFPSGRTARTTSTPSGPERSQPSSTAPAVSSARRGRNPASGSLNSWHQISSAVRIGGSQRSFWSSVPCASSVGPARLMPTRLIGCSARERAYSMLKIATCTGDAAPAVLGSANGCRPSGRAASRACHAGRTRPLRRWSRTAAAPRRSRRATHFERERLLLGGEGEIHALQVPEPFAPYRTNDACSTASSVPVNGRKSVSPRSRTKHSSPLMRSWRNFWCTSVRFTILFVPVVGGSRRIRT